MSQNKLYKEKQTFDLFEILVPYRSLNHDLLRAQEFRFWNITNLRDFKFLF